LSDKKIKDTLSFANINICATFILYDTWDVR